MFVPEFLAHLGRFEPCIHQYSVRVRQGDEPFVIVRVFRELVPSGNMDNTYALVHPLFNERFDAVGLPKAGVEVHLQIFAADNRPEAKIFSDVFQRERVLAVPVLRVRIERRVEVNGFSFADFFPYRHRCFGDIVDAEDFIYTVGFKFADKLGVAPGDPLLGKIPVVNPADADVRLGEADAEFFSKVIFCVGNDIPAAFDKVIDDVIVRLL